jgi:hypothetical protein
VDLLQHKGGQGLRVSDKAYVLNQRGKPIMPCSSRKARLLLKKGEAKVVKTNPFFVIQLTKATGESVSKMNLGIDSGSKFVGFSVIDSKKEILCGTLDLDLRTSERLKERSMYRRLRRRKLWYRKPRFNNRTKPKGSLTPSIQRKFDTHIKLINKIKEILPIKNLFIEVGNFDIQKIENPDIKGIQYQQGSMYEYQNMRSFLISREESKCQLCGDKLSKSNSSHIHHIIPRSKGGTDREKNLALLHKKCHYKLHQKKLFDSLKINRQYKDATFMLVVRWKYREVFPEARLVYGTETFINRNILRLEKTHFNDAFVIAKGQSQTKINSISLKQKHRNNRVLQCNRKGSKPLIRRKRYLIRPGDIVTIKNKKYISRGSTSFGSIIRYFDKSKKLQIGIKKIQKVYHTKSIFKNVL